MKTEDCLMCLLSNCPEHGRAGPILAYRKGHILFHQGLPNPGLFYIFEGVVKLYSHCESGKKIIHALLPPGELAGLSALSEETFSPISAEVIEDARLFYLDRSDVQDLFRTQPFFAKQILKRIFKAQLDAYNRNDQLINSNVRERMANCLLELSQAFGTKEEKNLRINLRLNRDELAGVIGVAPETVIRFLSEFKRSGLITEDDRKIIILDKKALKQVCHRM